jgi:beta-phosphoglucomutase
MTNGTDAVLWDMDGTLVDTAELHFAAWKETSEELRRPFTRADFAATFGRRNPEICEYLVGRRFSAKEVADIGDVKEERYRGAAVRQGVVLLPGVRSLLDGLHAAGFKQAIGSSAPQANVDLILQLTAIAARFEAVVSMEDTQRGKPDPQVFLVGAQKLAAEPARCVVIEDAVAGVQAARNGGMRCIAVRFVGHHPEDSLRAAGADLVVRTLEEVTVPVVKRLLAEPARLSKS